jgi:hypothetical protein
MAFGRNPHVAKALAAEQKANEAPDDASRARALRDAAHQWERAAERETQASRRAEYERNATRNRESADGDAPAATAALEEAAPTSGEAAPVLPTDPKMWN